MLFFIRSIFAQTLLNAYFVYRIWKSREIAPFIKWFLFVIYATETCLYFVGLFGSERLSIDFYTLIQKISGIWVIAHVYLAILLLIFDLIHYIDKKWFLFGKFRNSTVRWTKISCFYVSFLFIGTQLYLGYENFLNPVIKTISFCFNTPVSRDIIPRKTYKILVASDIHLGYIIDKKILQRYVKIINAQQADIVIINGDLIDYSLRPLVAEKMDEELKKIRAPKGVFFIPGNHEYKFNPELKLDWIRSTEMIVLKDSIANIDNQFYLIGRDDRSNKDRETTDDFMKEVDISKPCVFLAHQPGDINDAYEYNIPLTICGHTHGGQAFPMNLFGHLLYTRTYGLEQKGNCFSYVTSGLGLSGFPLRIGTHSEIVIFNIEI